MAKATIQAATTGAATTDAATINWLEHLKLIPTTHQGWIRAVRVQHNMQAKQLAEKMHVSPARISVLEKDELRGAVTLKMMQKTADALDCTFVYALIPKTVQQAAKPRLRLDAAYMKADTDRQGGDLQQQYERELLKTTPG